MPGSRTISAPMLTHIGQSTTTLAVCWKITRTDSVVQGFTSHDQDITFETQLYKAATGIAPTAVKTSVGTGVDNLAVMGTLRSADITKVDLMNGVYDYATVSIFLVNYKNLADGNDIVLAVGRLGEVKANKNSFEAEVRSLIQLAAQNIGLVGTPTCNVHDLGDARCTVDLNGTAFTGSDNISIKNATTVASVTDRRIFTLSTVPTNIIDDWYKFGKCEFTSGNNDGLIMDVKKFTISGSEIELQFEAAKDIQIGDGVLVTAGCDRLFNTCKVKFNNVLFFRGFPHVPGIDVTVRIVPAT